MILGVCKLDGASGSSASECTVLADARNKTALGADVRERSEDLARDSFHSPHVEDQWNRHRGARGRQRPAARVLARRRHGHGLRFRGGVEPQVPRRHSVSSGVRAVGRRSRHRRDPRLRAALPRAVRCARAATISARRPVDGRVHRREVRRRARRASREARARLPDRPAHAARAADRELPRRAARGAAGAARRTTRKPSSSICRPARRRRSSSPSASRKPRRPGACSAAARSRSTRSCRATCIG